MQLWGRKAKMQQVKLYDFLFIALIRFTLLNSQTFPPSPNMYCMCFLLLNLKSNVHSVYIVCV